MKVGGEKLVSDIQYCLVKGVAIHPHAYFEFLKQLHEMSQRNKVSMVPLAMLEYFTLRVKRKMTLAIERYKLRKVA